MHFTTPQVIQEIAWEGELSAPGLMMGAGGAAAPVVTVGKPEVWTAEQALESETGKKWTPPLGEARFWLVRLACTLHPPAGRSAIVSARQALILRPIPASAGTESVYAHNLFPQRLGVDEKTDLTWSLGPELKFASGAGVKAGEVGATIEFHKVFPVIQAYGLGEASAYWDFQPHAAHPLLGSQFVYAVLAARQPANGLRGHVEVTVSTQSTLGPVRYGLPETARKHTSFELP